MKEIGIAKELVFTVKMKKLNKLNQIICQIDNRHFHPWLMTDDIEVRKRFFN